MLLYATNGGLWQYGSRITYSFVPDGTSVGGVPSNLYATLNAVAPTATWQQQFEKAAALWSSYAHINLALVPDNGAALGSAGNQQDDPNFGDIRIAMASQSGGVLAFAMLPPPYNGGSNAGDVVFNSNIAWKVNTDYDIETVALHEIGHALGMDHSAISTAVMYAYYNGMKQSVTTDDASGIQSIYGVFPTDSDTNRSFSTATNITSQINNNQVAISGLNLAGTSDYDYWLVTVPSTTTGTMTVTMQSNDLSSVSPRLVIYNASNTSQAWQTTLPNSFGASATMTLSVSAGQSYYIRASAASALGSYGAYGVLANFGSGAQSPIAPPNTVVTARPDQGGGSSNLNLSPWAPPSPPTVQDEVLQLLDQLHNSERINPRLENFLETLAKELDPGPVKVTYGTLTGFGDELRLSPAHQFPNHRMIQPASLSGGGASATNFVGYQGASWLTSAPSVIAPWTGTALQSVDADVLQDVGIHRRHHRHSA